MVDGVSCPLLGRVTMDQIIVDVSRAPHAEPGMTAEIMGPHIPVTELAEKAGTIWEIFTGIGPGFPAITIIKLSTGKKPVIPRGTFHSY